MKITLDRRCLKKAVSLHLLLILFGSTSMYVAAASTRPVGELILTRGKTDRTGVKVDGQPATNGRTVFESSTITTPEDSSAVINFGNSGKLQLDPSSSFVITSVGDKIGGELLSGSVTVLTAADHFRVKTLAGEVLLKTGQSVRANSARAARDHRDAAGNCIDDDNDGELECDYWGIPAWGWWTILGVAATVTVIAIVASRDDDDDVVSPVR
jgi:hypothetical protein